MNLQKIAVIGHPIGHTMSPFIHRRLFALSGIPLDYSVLDIPDLDEAMPELCRLDGFNVTIPHKAGIIPYPDGLDKKASLFGSVNTVACREGKLLGYTTDGTGCLKALENHGLDFSGPLVILGNGGAARAIAFEAAVRQKDFHITLACRGSSVEKAKLLAEEVACFARKRGDRDFWLCVKTYKELEGREPLGLLLNATSVGMYPHAGASPVPDAVVQRCSAVFDAVYNPGETALLKQAKASGCKTIGGMEMLVYQAVAAHELWYGTTFRTEEIQKLCVDADREMRGMFGGSEG